MTERLLNDKIAAQVREIFKDLKNPVQVFFFGQKQNCEYCADTQQLVSEVTGLSDLLHLEVYDLDEHAQIASQYGVDKAPGLVLAGKDGEKILDYGVRLSGIPAGHEFNSLIHDLLLVSSQDSGLSQPTRDFLAGLKQPVHLQVFVTPT